MRTIHTYNESIISEYVHHMMMSTKKRDNGNDSGSYRHLAKAIEVAREAKDIGVSDAELDAALLVEQSAYTEELKKEAQEKFNSIMRDIGREETIGKKPMLFKAMVSEMEYTLQLWNDPDSIAYIDAHDDDQPIVNGKKQWLYNWQKEKARMKRFIVKYFVYIER